MGADFNILEYADPELGDIGEKTNILDENLDLEEPDPKKEAAQQPKTETGDTSSAEHSSEVNTTSIQGQPSCSAPGSTPHHSQVAIF